MNSDETLEQTTEENKILQAIAELSKKIDDLEKKSEAQFEEVKKRLATADIQFEAIRQGIVDNNVRLHRIEGNVHLLQAEVTALGEEVRHNRKIVF